MPRHAKSTDPVPAASPPFDAVVMSSEGMPRTYLTILVADLDRSIAFYAAAFGFFMWHFQNEAGQDLAYGDTGRTVVSVVTWELVMPKGHEQVPYVRCDAPQVRLTFATRDLDAAVAKALDAGAVLVDRYRTRLDEVACLRDPDGLLVELHRPAE